MAVLAVLLAAALWKVWHRHFRWFRVLLSVGAAGWLLLNYANVDDLVARYNIGRGLDTGAVLSASDGRLGALPALEELLEQRDLLRELVEDVYSVSGDTAALIRNLPEGLSPEREAVVRTACSLVGKVNYFWGGKSLVIGWDVRWGELRQVTAAGSSTTGTYRPYGLDCSGFVIDKRSVELKPQ